MIPVAARPASASTVRGARSAEYLGSKRALLPFITDAISQVAGDSAGVIDLFAGTGAVAGAFKALGYRVTANDHLAVCHARSAAVLLNDRTPEFHGIAQASESNAYLNVLAELNNLEPVLGGFIYRNYSPAAFEDCGIDRMYFTADNAARIDTVRSYIERLRPSLLEGEYYLLLADLLQAATAVSNVAGTYGCYLKSFKPRALDTLTLRPSGFINGRGTGHMATCMEAESLLETHSAEVVYADPPYTKRQYAAYYHVLETIIRDDKPSLTGTTGLRYWQSQSSDFCYKRRAPAALERLVRSADCAHLFLSYNEDGQIGHGVILDVLGAYGNVSVRETSIRRYKSSALPHKGPNVVERLYHLSKS